MPPTLVVNPDVRAVAGSLEQVRESIEDAEQKRFELKLTVMQTRTRLAELKATLRAVHPFVAPGAM